MSLESSPLLDPDGLVGRVLAERYLIEERLGEGGMGTVYRAAHVKVGRSFAIKVLHPELLRNEKVVFRFEREAESAARMRHPNVVPALDVGTTEEGLRYLVMDFVDGPDLAEIMLEAPMPPPRVIWLVRQILEGLQHAHHHGLVHRDLKPQNIIVETDADGREIPRIVDFGISILASDEDDESARLTTSGMVLGTPLYMAPEQAVAGDIDHRVDLFALGLIVYEMLSGALPFDGTGAQVARANLMLDPPAMSRRVPDLSVDPLLEAFTRKLMARDRDKRPGTAREARELLDLIERDRKAAAAILSVASDAAPSQIMTVPRLPSVGPGSASAPSKQVDRLAFASAVTEISDKIPAGSSPLVMVQEEGSEVVVSLAPLESGPSPRPGTSPHAHGGHTGPIAPSTTGPAPASFPLPYFPGDPAPMVAQPFQHNGVPDFDRRAERYTTTEHGYRHAVGKRRRWLVASIIGSVVMGVAITAVVMNSGPKQPTTTAAVVADPPPVAPPESGSGDAPDDNAPGSAGSAEPPAVVPPPVDGIGKIAPGKPVDQPAGSGSGSAGKPPRQPKIKPPINNGNNGNNGSDSSPVTRPPVDDEPVVKPPKPPSDPVAKAPSEPVAKPVKPPDPAPVPAAPVTLSAKYRTVAALIGKVPAGDEQAELWKRYRFINKDKAAGDDKLRARAMDDLAGIERDAKALIK